MNRVAALIVNYNMSERADALADYIKAHVKHPCDVYLLDNGSDIQKPARNTTHILKENRQTTGGWLYLLDNLPRQYFAYWFLITSAEFVECSGDPLTPAMKIFDFYSHAVAVHPALTHDSTTSWNHMKKLLPSGYRLVFMVDNIASIYRADWFDSIGRFDPALMYAWGIDLETCWKARRDGKSIWISEEVPVKKVTNIGYTMNRMNMSANDREKLAGDNMRDVLSRRYGADWWNRMLHEFAD